MSMGEIANAMFFRLISLIWPNGHFRSTVAAREGVDQIKFPVIKADIKQAIPNKKRTMVSVIKIYSVLLLSLKTLSILATISSIVDILATFFCRLVYRISKQKGVS